MIATSILGTLLLLGISFLAMYLFRRRSGRRVPAIGEQRICPNCGLITSRARAACLECGKVPMI